MNDIFATPEVKEQIKTWINALESGKYKQGKKALNPSHNHYCCLGVACEVLVPEYKRGEKGRLLGLLPCAEYGAPQWLADIGNDFGNKTGRNLILLNDDYNFSFEEIAELLRLVYLEEMSVDLREL